MRESLRKLKLAYAMVQIDLNLIVKHAYLQILNNSVVEFLIYTWFNLISKEAQIFLKKEGSIHQKHDLNIQLKSQQLVSNLS